MRLRAALPFVQWPRAARYAGLVRSAEEMLGALRPSPLACHVRAGEIHIGGRAIRLPAQQLAFYALFARRKATGCVRPALKACGDCSECYFSAGKDFPQDQAKHLVDLHRAAGGRDAERLAAALAGPDAPALLRQLKSKANQAILEALGGELAAAPYLVRGVGAYAKRHGLSLDKGLIEVRL